MNIYSKFINQCKSINNLKLKYSNWKIIKPGSSSFSKMVLSSLIIFSLLNKFKNVLMKLGNIYNPSTLELKEKIPLHGILIHGLPILKLIFYMRLEVAILKHHGILGAILKFNKLSKKYGKLNN